MRKALLEIASIDAYLQGQLREEELNDFQFRLLTEPELTGNIQAQRKTHRLIQQTARAQLREELEAIHDRLWRNPEQVFFRR